MKFRQLTELVEAAGALLLQGVRRGRHAGGGARQERDCLPQFYHCILKLILIPQFRAGLLKAL